MNPVPQNPKIPEQQPLPQVVTPTPQTPVTQATSNYPRMVVHTQVQNSSNWENLSTTLDTPLNPDAHTTTTTTSSTYTTTTTTVTSSEEKKQTDIKLKNRPAIDILPLEMKFEVFSHLSDEIERETGLLAFGKTSAEQRSAVIDYFHHSKEGIAHGLRIAAADVKIWNACAKHLRENIVLVRDTIADSLKMIQELAKSGISDQEIANSVNKLAGVQLDFTGPLSKTLITEILKATHKKPVKINANDIGRDRFLAEVLPALRKVNPGCQVVLDAKDNKLTADDLQLLVDFMKENPCIYRLDLQNNFFSVAQICMPVVELFHLNGPLTHLCLAWTGINNETASLVAEALANHPVLTTVDLRFNLIETSGMLAIIKAVGSLDENGEIHINMLFETVRLRNLSFHVNCDSVLIMEAAKIANSLAISGSIDDVSSEIQYHKYVVQIEEIDRNMVHDLGFRRRVHERFDRFASIKKL